MAAVVGEVVVAVVDDREREGKMIGVSDNEEVEEDEENGRVEEK